MGTVTFIDKKIKNKKQATVKWQLSSYNELKMIFL